MAHVLNKSEKEKIILSNQPNCLKKVFIAVLRKLKLGSFTRGPLNNPPTVPVKGG